MIRILLARMVIYRLGRLISPNSSPPQSVDAVDPLVRSYIGAASESNEGLQGLQIV